MRQNNKQRNVAKKSILKNTAIENNLIEFVWSANYSIIYGVGDTMPAETDDYGNPLKYNFTVDELTDEFATITFFLQ